MVTFCLSSCDLHPCFYFLNFFFYCSWFDLFRPFIRHPFVCLHASPCLNFLFFPQYCFFRHSLSQPPLLLPLHLPCPLLEVALPLSLPPFPIPLLPPPRSPIMRRLGRPRWDYCLPCWRTRPGGFTRRRPSFSSASPWVSGACDIGWAHTPESKSFRISSFCFLTHHSRTFTLLSCISHVGKHQLTGSECEHVRVPVCV